VVLQPWLCGSVDLTANENIHHEEEAWPDFCCSLLLVRSLRSSGYIQEGQGVNHDYLLLGVYYINSPSCTLPYSVTLPAIYGVSLFLRVVSFMELGEAGG
jgi:hypothetical protein